MPRDTEFTGSQTQGGNPRRRQAWCGAATDRGSTLERESAPSELETERSSKGICENPAAATARTLGGWEADGPQGGAGAGVAQGADATRGSSSGRHGEQALGAPVRGDRPSSSSRTEITKKTGSG